MNRTFSRPTSLRGLLAAAAAGLAALSVNAPVTASGGAGGSASVQLSSTARHVVLRDLPRAGSGPTRVLPRLRPNSRSAPAAARTGTSTGSAQTADTAAPRTATAGASGFEGDSYTQQTTTFPGPGGSPTTSDQAAVPPDNGTAVSPQYVVEFLNSSGWVYLRNNGNLGDILSIDLNKMFIAPSDQNSYFFTDPRIVWDPSATTASGPPGRWWASGLAFTSSLATKEYIAVSDNWDATGGWTVNQIFASTTVLGDQPRLGVTSDKVVDFWDDYNSSTSAFTQEEGMTVTKAALEAGTTPDGTNSHDFTNSGWVAVVPAWYSTTADTWAVWNDTDNTFTQPAFTADGKVHVIHVAGTATSPTFTTSTFTPSAGITVGGTGLEAPQSGTNPPQINADDDRVTTTTFDGTHLVASANTGCGSVVCARIFRATISSGSPTYVGDANIGAAGLYVYYGAPVLDGSGNLTVGFSESNGSMFPSTGISGATAGSPLSFSAPALVKAGQATYNEPLFATPPNPATGNPGECVPSLAPCRWGDYSGAQPDPCDSTFVWTSDEFADGNTTSGANWATWITPVTFGGGSVPAGCANAPTVSSVTESCGKSGDAVAITGTNFVAGSVVYFGITPVTPTINSTTSITATVPSGSGTVDVTVVNSGGQSALSAADRFSYVSGAPSVSGVAPDTQPADGTTSESVTVSGANFQYPLTIHFGAAGSQVVSNTGPGATCTSVVVSAPTSSTPQTVDVTAQDGSGTSATNANDKFYYVDGGYTLNAYGAVNEYGNVQAPPHRTDGPSWPGWAVARQMVLRSDRGSGYVLDAFGGIHPFGGAPALTGAPYWGWDIARDIVLDPCDTTQMKGYVLDGWGGIHSVGGATPITDGPYWPGWDHAKQIVMNSCGHGGYVLDNYGGLHPFSTAAAAPAVTDNPTWPGWNVVAGVVLTGDGMGYEVDDFGGVHSFGGAPTATGFAYYGGWYIITGVTVVPGVAGGYTLDAFGGVHPFSGAHSVTYTGYSGGNYIFRDID